MTTLQRDAEKAPSERFATVFFGVGSAFGFVSAVSQIIDFVESGKFSALAYTAAFMVLFVSCGTAAIYRHKVGRLLERMSGSQQSRHWYLPASAILAVVLAMVLSVLIGCGVVGRPWSGAAEESPVVFSTLSPGQSPGLPWTDSFDEPNLDPRRWRPSPLPDVIHVRDGKLRFDVALSADDKQISRLYLAPIPVGWPIGRVDMTVSAEQMSGELAGGAVLLVRQESGRITGVGFGPSKAGPVIEPWICRKSRCAADYNDYSHPPDKQVMLNPGKGMPVRIAQTGRHVEVQTGGIEFSANDDPSPILDIRFRLDAGPGDHWSAAVDDLELTPASR